MIDLIQAKWEVTSFWEFYLENYMLFWVILFMLFGYLETEEN